VASIFARQHTGDRAFTTLVESQRGPLERYVRGLGASHEDAEEIASAALLRAYLNAPPTLDDPDGQRAWLRTVAKNLWIDRTRRLRLKLVTEEASVAEQAQRAPAADAERVVELAYEARSVLAAMALLAPSQRAMLYLREVRGLSYAEIAEELGTTLPAVESTLHRARHSLARTLKGKNRGVRVRGLALAPLFLVHRWSGRAAAAVHAVPQAVAVKVAIPAVVALTAGGLVVTHHVPTLPLIGASHQTAATTHRTHHGAARHGHTAGRHLALARHGVTAGAAGHGAHGWSGRTAASSSSTHAASLAATAASSHGHSGTTPRGMATRAHGPGHGQSVGHTIGTRAHGKPVHAKPVKTRPVRTRPPTAKAHATTPPAGSKAHTPSGTGQPVKPTRTPPPTAHGQGSGSSSSTPPNGNQNGHAASPTPATAGGGNADPSGQAKKTS
jgi:RNA polymerase sigma-70 factor (ECF subfamily)